jgi:hypothetical protein
MSLTLRPGNGILATYTGNGGWGVNYPQSVQDRYTPYTHAFSSYFINLLFPGQVRIFLDDFEWQRSLFHHGFTWKTKESLVSRGAYILKTVTSV